MCDSHFLSFKWEWLLGIPGECLATSFQDKLLMTSLAPLGVIMAAFAGLALRAALSSGSVRGAFGSAILSVTPFALLVTFTFVPSVSANIFKAWSCEAFGYTASEELFFLREDLSIQCYTDAQNRTRNVALGFVLLVRRD